MTRFVWKKSYKRYFPQIWYGEHSKDKYAPPMIVHWLTCAQSNLTLEDLIKLYPEPTS